MLWGGERLGQAVLGVRVAGLALPGRGMVHPLLDDRHQREHHHLGGALEDAHLHQHVHRVLVGQFLQER